jgi:hypothetical protein
VVAQLLAAEQVVTKLRTSSEAKTLCIRSRGERSAVAEHKAFAGAEAPHPPPGSLRPIRR